MLVVCATAAERDAAARSLVSMARLGPAPRTTGPGDLVPADTVRAETVRAETAVGRVDLLVGGVGVAATAAATSAALGDGNYDLVVSAGIAGGFAPVAIGTTVIATAVVQVDLGAEDGSDFLPLSALGLGAERHELDPALVRELAARTGAVSGAVLTVCTVTGSAATAAARRQRCPDAVAEAMEGAGALAAARLHGVAFAEMRTVSNAVGPRDRGAWRIEPALAALADAVAAITAAPWELSTTTRAAGS